MTRTAHYIDIPVADLLNRESSFYTQPWPDVILRSIDVLQPYQATIMAKGSPKLIRFNAPPLKGVLNMSRREVRFDGERYLPMELAFLRDGKKIAAIPFVAGPHAQLAIAPDVQPVSATHGQELARAIEDEIITALEREIARQKAQP